MQPGVQRSYEGSRSLAANASILRCKRCVGAQGTNRSSRVLG